MQSCEFSNVENDASMGGRLGLTPSFPSLLFQRAAFGEVQTLGRQVRRGERTQAETFFLQLAVESVSRQLKFTFFMLLLSDLGEEDPAEGRIPDSRILRIGGGPRTGGARGQKDPG